MRWVLAVLFLILHLPLGAQEEDRKPSPFPEVNREREAAAKKKAAAARAKRTVTTHPRTGAADRVAGTAPDGATFGKACFFAFKPGTAMTASGVDTLTDEFVAAHATYPFGSRVTVTNLGNGNSIEVTVIDRLADSRRIISVSEAAARRLGFYDAGIANVKVEPVRESEAHR